MKKAMALTFLLCGCSRFAVYTNSVEVPIHRVSPAGVGEEIGTIVLADSRKDGLIITTDLKGLTQGEHGFHIHQNPSCAPGEKDGKVIAAGAAGPHYDPHQTGAHKGPRGGGHEGDLPKLLVDGDGNADESIIMTDYAVKDFLGRSIMIHEGGDSYSDKPTPLGGGGARIACGVIP